MVESRLVITRKPRREVRFPAKDTALRDDVRALGALVGDVIREQGGDALFRDVETARLAAIRRREGDPTGERDLAAVVRRLDPERAAALVRGFSTYFQVVNLAERIHRIRRRRDYLREGGSPQPGGLLATVRRLAASGIGLRETQRLLSRLRVEPVFTAHPTEATRPALLEKQQRIARRLVERLDPSRTPSEERAAMERIRADVTAGWQTEEYPPERPTVMDEMDHVLFYLTEILFRVIPPFYESLEEALVEVHGDRAASVRQPIVIRFASWVGGDMDGNPNVTAETIEAALARHRALVLSLYRREVLELSALLTQSPDRAGFDPGISARLRRYGRLFPAERGAIPARHRDMPYRTLLRLMAARLEATGRDDRRGYPDASALIEDLETIAVSLSAHRGGRAGLFAVRRALRRAETFGFHLATLDVRQDAAVHRGVTGRLLGEPRWQELSPEARADRMARALATGRRPARAARGASVRTLEVFRAIAACRDRYGEHAIGPYIVSMARDVEDVLAVLLLARWAGLGPKRGPVPIDVAPLFETVPDLAAAPNVMRTLIADPAYRSHLSARGDRQVVMIGYSDSNKEGGIASSRWNIQVAQAGIAEALQEAGVEPILFHGRGGTISRGGGKMHRAVLAAPPAAVRGRLRLTEQGEAIDAKYGLRAIAMRNLEQLVGAVALATAGADTAPAPPAEWMVIMDGIARASREAYRDLVYDQPRFAEYFRLATPIDVIERMPIGSRPPSRRPGGGIESLRAIPWVFAWTQSRHILPGWYGLGTGLAGAVKRHGRTTLARMAREWPFFSTLLDDAEMVLAKADMPIAERYARLAGDLGRTFFPRIRSEFDLTARTVLSLRKTRALLDHDPALQRSIRLRNPYVDPMSLLQVDLLARWRASGRRNRRLFDALLATVMGIARGLQNTG